MFKTMTMAEKLMNESMGDRRFHIWTPRKWILCYKNLEAASWLVKVFEILIHPDGDNYG